jgi:hypothetical protein
MHLKAPGVRGCEEVEVALELRGPRCRESPDEVEQRPGHDCEGDVHVPRVRAGGNQGRERAGVGTEVRRCLEQYDAIDEVRYRAEKIAARVPPRQRFDEIIVSTLPARSLPLAASGPAAPGRAEVWPPRHGRHRANLVGALNRPAQANSSKPQPTRQPHLGTGQQAGGPRRRRGRAIGQLRRNPNGGSTSGLLMGGEDA